MSLIYTSDSSSTGGKRNRLYIGGRSDAKNRDKLRDWGSGVPNFFEKERTFVYKRIPVYDVSASASDLLSHADEIVDFITKGLCHGGVFVHCNMGQSRSTTAALFFLLRKANMSLTNAMDLVKRRRPEAEPIPAFREILETYEARCKKERPKDTGSSSSKDHPLSPNVKKRSGPSAASGPSVNNSDVSNSKEKRRRIGPAIGPSIGPSTGPSNEPSSTTGSPAKKAPGKKAIGPAMPPTMPPTEDSPKQVPTTAKSSIGPSLPPSTANGAKSVPAEEPPNTTNKSIGPSPPPL